MMAQKVDNIIYLETIKIIHREADVKIMLVSDDRILRMVDTKIWGDIEVRIRWKARERATQ